MGRREFVPPTNQFRQQQPSQMRFGGGGNRHQQTTLTQPKVLLRQVLSGGEEEDEIANQEEFKERLNCKVIQTRKSERDKKIAKAEMQKKNGCRQVDSISAFALEVTKHYQANPRRNVIHPQELLLWADEFLGRLPLMKDWETILTAAGYLAPPSSVLTKRYLNLLTDSASFLVTHSLSDSLLIHKLLGP